MTDATHARGCDTTELRPSALLVGYDYCPTCRRLIKKGE